MCERCTDRDDLFRSIDARIDERLWYLISNGFGPGAVEGGTWIHSVGLVEGFGHPEIVFVGAGCERCSVSVVDLVAARVVAGERFDADSVSPRVIRDGDLDVAFHVRRLEGRPLTTSWFAAWHAYYASKPWEPPPLSAVQIVRPDSSGIFPWEPGCDARTARVQQVPDWPPRRTRAARRRAAKHRR